MKQKLHITLGYISFSGENNICIYKWRVNHVVHIIICRPGIGCWCEEFDFNMCYAIFHVETSAFWFIWISIDTSCLV